MGKLALLDVVRPYFFLGVDLGPGVNDVLKLLHVDEYDVAWDDDAVTVWGVARIDQAGGGSPTFSPFAGTGSAGGSTTRDRVEFEWHDAAITFRLTSARLPASALVSTQITVAPVQSVVETFGPAAGTAPSDYPNTQFRLDLLFNLVTLTFPKLIGAKLEGAYLVPDPENRAVKIDLPRILLRIEQDSASDTDFDVDLATWGAETLDDADAAIGSLIKMRPTYALADGKKFGFGFEKAVIDFSDESTPPDILERFGLGDDFKGIYLPEFRLFFADEATTGTAGNVGVSDLVIGIAPEPAVWGDLSFDVDFRGDALAVGLRLFSVSGEQVPPVLVEPESGDASNAQRYRVTVPSSAGPLTENYLLYIDVTAGAAPFTITAITGLDIPTPPPPPATPPSDPFPNDVVIDGHPDKEDLSVLARTRLFSHNQRVMIRVEGRNPADKRYILLDVHPDLQAAPLGSDVEPPAAPRVHLDPPSPTTPGTISIVDATNPNQVVIRVTAGGVVAGVTMDGDRATIPLAPGDTTPLDVNWSASGDETLARVKAYFPFAEPGRDETVDGATMSSSPIVIDGSASPIDLTTFQQEWETADLAGSPSVRIDAYASREADRNTDYNDPLSLARATALRDRLVDTIESLEVADVSIAAWGEHRHPDALTEPDVDQRLIKEHVPGNQSADAAVELARLTGKEYLPKEFRIAVASLLVPSTTSTDYSGTLRRDKVEHPERTPAPAPPASQEPDWLRSIGGTIRWEREPYPIAGELRLTVDFATAHEDGLEEFREDIEDVRPGLEAPEEGRLPTTASTPNPDDGVVDFRLTITYDPATGTVTETLVARAGEGDRDGLWSWGSIPATDIADPPTDPWRDILGLYFALAPLTADAAADQANGGEIAPLVVSLATPVVVTALGVAHVMRYTHYGVELGVSHDDDEFHAALLFDVESAVWLNFKVDDFVIVTTRTDKPIKIRYKAIGFQIDAEPEQPVRFLPVFDSSRGYTIDLADSGSLKVLPSLGDAIGDIIQVLGARIARTNPLNIEVDLGLGVDLGVFKVERFGFRLPIDPLGAPSITAIGIGVDIPDTLVGHGYLQIFETGFAGQLDLTLPSVGLRVAAGLRVQTVTEGDRSATGVVVTLSVEFPGGIPLGGTGLAIFGFLGLFAMHHKRLEDPSARNPALSWLVDRVAGDPTRIEGWGPALDSWAFGVGLVAGTIEGGTILNLKGMLVVESPGPRVILFVKANLLSAKPPTKGTETGALLAVVDVSPQRVLIGIQIHYEIKEILDIQIPIEAGFFSDRPEFPPEHFYVDVGTIAVPVKATVLEIFKATAYFMVHGDGIEDFPLVEGGLEGFSLATGFSVSIVWGNTDIGLYLKAAGGFDAGMGFAPFFFAGRVYFEGALHLFIISLEVRAELALLSDGDDTLFKGEICGKVSFFFFSVQGCVDFELGVDPAAPHAPKPIRDLTLQSRSPALVEGTAVDRGIDAVLCHGTEDGSIPVVDDSSAGPREVKVPIDAIPLVQFEVAPVMSAVAIDGELSGTVPAGEAGWQKRGPNFLRYTVTKVELRLVRMSGATPPAGTTPTTEGPRPYTWRRGPHTGGSDGLPVDLAMLDWKPSNVDKAMLEGEPLDGVVDDRWDHICVPTAEAASVLWTFRNSPLGPNDAGWPLRGEAWPDAPGTRRTLPVRTDVRVRETWRTGTVFDGLLPHKAAEVQGIPSKCPKLDPPPIGRPPIGLPSIDRPSIDRTPIGPIGGVGRSQPGGRVPRLGPPIERLAALSRLMAPDNEVGVAAAQLLCQAKVLEAPYELLASAATPGLLDNPLTGAIKELDELRAEELRDVLRISGGPHRTLTLLIVANSKIVESGLMAVQAFDASNKEIPGVAVDFQLVGTVDDLPKRWTDTGGPWCDDVQLARNFTLLLDGLRLKDEYVVRIELPEPALHVDIGIRPLALAISNFDLSAPSWFLAIIEGLSEREIIREDDDNAETDGDGEALEDALEGKGHALLRPDAEYEVVVHYQAEIGRKPTDPDEDQDPNEIQEVRSPVTTTDKRTFFTDDEAPRNLEPWSLVQFPAPDEPHHFYEDPVVFVFATDDVLELYGAYDRTLQAVARAASFRGSAGTPEGPLTHLLLAEFMIPLGSLVLSPYEATVRRRIGGRPCHELDPDSNNHTRAVVPFHLDPVTDYVVDIEALTPSGDVATSTPLDGEIGVRPLYRQRMTTSRYANRDALAEAVRTTAVVSQRLGAVSPLTALDGVVSDDDFDLAMIDAGLEARPRPTAPEVFRLWSPDPVAVPIALLLETPEPLWRSRLEPEPVYADDGIHILQWKLARTDWLIVDELVPTTPAPASSGGPFIRPLFGTMTTVAPTIPELRDRYLHPLPPGPPPSLPPSAKVTRIVRDTSGARTLVFLEPGSRGAKVTLGLARNLHPLIDVDETDTAALLLEVTLDPPAWETS